MDLSPSWEATSCSVTQSFQNIFFGTRRFIIVFTRARYWSLSWARWIQHISSHLISLRLILIFSYNLRRGLSSSLFPSGFPTKETVCIPPRPMRATFFAHPLLNDSNYTWQTVQIMKLFIMQFPQSSITLSLFGPNILLSILVSNTLRLCSSLNVRDQVSHPYKTTGKIIFLHIFIFYSFRQQMKRKQVRNCALFPHKSNFYLLLSSPNILTLPHFKGSISYLYVMILLCVLVTRHRENAGLL
jgi:hypothetical protein